MFYSQFDNSLYIFNDKLGIFDVFYFLKGNLIFISNYFAKILRNYSFNQRDLDYQALYEFFLFEFPLFDKTFIKKIKRVPLGSICYLNITNFEFKVDNYYDYIFKIDNNIRENEIIEVIDKNFENAIQNIKNLNSRNTIYGLGLSGGMDSKLTAYFAKKAKMKLKTFIFGEKPSDAYLIARKIAKEINLDHYELGVNYNFYDYAIKSIQYKPLMNVQYAWYYAIYEKLPKFDILLTGFHGDNQFGSHLKNSDKYIVDNNSFITRLLNHFCQLGYNKNINKFLNEKKFSIQKIINEIEHFTSISKNDTY